MLYDYDKNIDIIPIWHQIIFKSLRLFLSVLSHSLIEYSYRLSELLISSPHHSMSLEYLLTSVFPSESNKRALSLIKKELIPWSYVITPFILF